MLYPEIMTVWDHTTSKEKPRSGVGGSEPRGLRTTYPPCKNERLERVELWPFFTYYMNQINLFFLNAHLVTRYRKFPLISENGSMASPTVYPEYLSPDE